MSAITAKASRKMKKYAVLTREPRCFLGSFDFSWEQRKLGDVVKEIIRNDPESEAPIMMITANNGFIEQSERYAFNNAGESLKKYILLKKGELAYNHGASKLRPYGSCFALTTAENARIPFVYHCFSAENQNAEFMSIELNGAEIENQLRKIVSSGARMDGLLNISFDEYTSVSVLLPGTEEQDCIADFFRHLDNLITLHQRKCANLCSPSQVVFSLLFATSTFSWEQRKVGDLLIERNQQAPMSDEYPLMAFIANEGVAPKGERYDRSALVTDTVNKLYKKTEKGDFIYSSNNLETGSIGLNKYGKACISPVYSIFEPTGIADSDFLGRRLVRKDFINAMVKWRQGVIYGQWRIHESDFLKIEITVPSVEEQRKIGTYLDQLDHLITLHQRECISFTGRADRLILTANKKRTTSSWEQRKVSDLAEKTYGGGTPTTSNEAYWNGDIPWIQSSDVVDGKLLGVEPRKWITQDGLNNSAAQLIPGNSIAIITRVGVGKLAFMPYSYATSQDFLSLSKLNAEPLFTVYACYKKLQSELNAVQGTSIKGITKDELLAKNIMVPRYAEQQQIGAFFKQLDNLITLHQRKPFLMKWRTSDANRNQTNRLVL